MDALACIALIMCELAIRSTSIENHEWCNWLASKLMFRLVSVGRRGGLLIVQVESGGKWSMSSAANEMESGMESGE